MKKISKKLIYLSQYTGSINKLIPYKFKAKLKRKNVTELIDVNELKPCLEDVCNYLLENVGEKSMGDYLEFGVCHGTSLNCMFQVLKERKLDQVRIFGFDSFEGLPELSEDDDRDTWKKGSFKSNIEVTKYYLDRQGIDWKKTHLIRGWFTETLTDETKQQYGIEKASIIMIDCDIYSATKQALQFSRSLIKDVTVIIFDDWNTDKLAERSKGEKKAFVEFLDENPYLQASEIGSYSYLGKPNGKIFTVINSNSI